MGNETSTRVHMLSEGSSTLTCKLTRDELLDKSAELARALEDIGVEEERQKEVKAELRSTLSAMQSTASKLASQVRRKEELRDVPVQSWLTEAGMVEKVRMDTNEIINTRRAHEAEKQMTLPEDAEVSEFPKAVEEGGEGEDPAQDPDEEAPAEEQETAEEPQSDDDVQSALDGEGAEAPADEDGGAE